MTQYDTETILRELYRSLDERWRPEDVAQKIVLVLPLVGSDREILEKAAKVSLLILSGVHLVSPNGASIPFGT